MAAIWLTIDEFCASTHLKRELVEKLIQDNKLTHKTEGEQVLIQTEPTNHSLVNIGENALSAQNDNAPIAFAEKTIGTILNLHEKVLEAKDESISTLKSENKFLKDALFSMQDIYDDDQKSAQFLREQLQRTQEELESMKRKYKLMWGKSVGKVDLSPLVKNGENPEQDSKKNQ